MMSARCSMSALRRVPECLSTRSNVGLCKTLRFYAQNTHNGKPLASHTKYVTPKVSWPRHPQHRLPSAWPFALAVTTPVDARNIVVQMDDIGRALLLEELKKHGEEKADAAAPGDVGEPPKVTASQLFDVFMFNGFPFIGFGILDNGIMIVAGEYIDVTIGAVLGISTMAAAALGNLISDVAGVGSAGYIETLVSKFGIKTPDVTPEQSSFKSVRWTIGLGRALGISLGCLIGMMPLLFFEKKDKEDEPEPASPSSV